MICYSNIQEGVIIRRILNDDESELWEIDYDSGHASNVSGYMKIDLLKQGSIIKYSGTIEDFL